MRASARFILCVVTSAIVAGCATGPKPGQAASLKDAVAPVWSLSATQNEMAVSVSPARRTMQLAGSSGVLIGASVAAVANDRYRRAIRDVLQGYDAGAVFEERLAARLKQTVSQDLAQVGPLSSTAGFQSKRDAEKARYESLAKRGADVLLDLNMTYGLFGPGGTLVTKLDGRLLGLPGGRGLWNDVIVVHTEPILADQKLSDPTKQFAPDFTSLRLTAEDDAITQWTRDGGQRLRKCFEESVDAVVSALLCDLGLAQEAVGEYYLGKLAMNRKAFDEADAHFRKALELDPNMIEARNGRAVNLAHNRQTDDAIKLAEETTTSAPDYAPAWYNLAWWYAIDKKTPEAAAAYYDKALALGMPANTKLEKAIGR